MKSYRDITGDGGSNVVAQVGEQLDRVNQRLSSVKHIVAVMSGKGGVGKSSVAVNLAAAMALQNKRVGILDADINGSSIPKLTGVRGQTLRRGPTGYLPPTNALDMKVMSIDLLLEDDREPVHWDAPSQHDAYTWRGMMEMGAIREFLADTEWGDLDYMFIDLPPGTDKLPNIVGLLPRITGTVIVTIPAAISQFVVGKSVQVAKAQLKTPIIGIIENMATHVCSKCGEEDVLFPGGHIRKMADEAGVPYLGGIPFDSRIALAGDNESMFMTEANDSAAAQSIRDIAGAVSTFVNDGGTQ